MYCCGYAPDHSRADNVHPTILLTNVHACDLINYKIRIK